MTGLAAAGSACWYCAQGWAVETVDGATRHASVAGWERCGGERSVEPLAERLAREAERRVSRRYGYDICPHDVAAEVEEAVKAALAEAARVARGPAHTGVHACCPGTSAHTIAAAIEALKGPVTS